ncbi:hypothetical protein O3P69_006155 [Scylla paramamosain]|uniref:Uncharacterized protein n=1 Tax=Scylla paramamosain TaxID=85552 RepID=A0AAW0U6Q6_SCYPA
MLDQTDANCANESVFTLRSFASVTSRISHGGQEDAISSLVSCVPPLNIVRLCPPSAGSWMLPWCAGGVWCRLRVSWLACLATNPGVQILAGAISTQLTQLTFILPSGWRMEVCREQEILLLWGGPL